MNKEQQIENYMKKLKISREEAEQLYNDDNSNEILPEVAEMEEKAKNIKNYTSSEKKNKTKNAPKKLDENKIFLIQTIEKLIRENNLNEMENIKIENQQREIIFDFKNENYSLTLTKHRKTKN
jgi:Asp-tRNA(Asn)/Glu-tRNA(Gln) amidotransferase B subunit